MKKGHPINPADRPDHPKPGPVISDPLGSYTGRPFDLWDLPIQDADDL